MTKKPAARKSPEQLKAAVWPDRAAALRDLKASGMPERGEDYTLAAKNPGMWMLMPNDIPTNGSPLREDKVIDLLKRKPGAPPRGEAAVIAHAKAPAKPSGKPAGKGRGGPGAKPPVKSPAPAETPPDPAPTPAESLFRDVLEELAEQAAPPEAAAAAATPVVKPLFDLSPAPVEAGPYEIVIRSADGGFGDNAVIAHAVTVSKKLKAKVLVRNGKGETIRSVDVAAMRLAQRQGAGRGRPNNSGAPKGVGKSDGAAKLFMRPQGATFKEVQVITEWSITDRFVRRVAAARDCDAVKLGDKHWKLVPKTV